ncbi:MAG: S9 family peptidase [Planctomycetota bacterium]|nr:S9 family peptidase [Planctomycetota bacterium]
MSKSHFLSSTTIYPSRKGQRRLTPELIWSIPRVGRATLSPDGQVLALPVTTADLEVNERRSRLWLVATDGSVTRPLTSPNATSAEPAFSPDGSALAFLRKEGEEKKQVHLLPLAGGEGERLTDLPLGVLDLRWLPDGSGIIVAAPLLKEHPTPRKTGEELARRQADPVKAHITEERVFRIWDRWLTGEAVHFFHLDPETRALRDLTPEAVHSLDWMDPAGHFDIAPDGSEIAFSGWSYDDERALLRSYVLTFSVAGGAVACLTADHPASDFHPRYSPDGSAILYGMKTDPFFYADRTRLMRYDRATGRHTPDLDDWDLSPHGWEFDADGTLYFLTEKDARMSLFVRKGSDAPREIVAGGWMTCAVRDREGRFFFDLQTQASPPEIHTCDPNGHNLTQLTHFSDAALKDVALGEVRDIRFKGAEGETVQMFLILPPEAIEGEALPLVHMIHGGPHGVFGDFFHFRWNGQLLAAPGYAVATVNFQGSTSWGQDFAQRIQGAWAARPFGDVMAATDALIEAGVADGTRLAAAGGSYGGYLVSWIAGHTDRFRCLVNHAGVYNCLSQFASDITQGRPRAMGGSPWEGIERLDESNPARYASEMKTPMLVLHGERDYRVPVTQGLECYSVLKAKGVEARLVHFPDEHHWILKPHNSIRWNDEVRNWFARFLR